jgi:hypothetical protein
MPRVVLDPGPHAPALQAWALDQPRPDEVERFRDPLAYAIRVAIMRLCSKLDGLDLPEPRRAARGRPAGSKTGTGGARRCVLISDRQFETLQRFAALVDEPNAQHAFRRWLGELLAGA